jgi:L-aspartate oxidase
VKLLRGNIESTILQVDGVQHCLGADILDQRRQTLTRFVAPVTMLATGGAGQVSLISLFEEGGWL